MDVAGIDRSRAYFFSLYAIIGICMGIGTVNVAFSFYYLWSLISCFIFLSYSFVIPFFILLLVGVDYPFCIITGYNGMLSRNIRSLEEVITRVKGGLLMKIFAVIFLYVTVFVWDSKVNLSFYFKNALSVYSSDIYIAEGINRIQAHLQCCGYVDRNDWNVNPVYRCTLFNMNKERCSVPPSCCFANQGRPRSKTCGKDALNFSSPMMLQEERVLYTEGCKEKIHSFIHKTAEDFLSFIFLLSILEILIWKCLSNMISTFHCVNRRIVRNARFENRLNNPGFHRSNVHN